MGKGHYFDNKVLSNEEVSAAEKVLDKADSGEMRLTYLHNNEISCKDFETKETEVIGAFFDEDDNIVGIRVRRTTLREVVEERDAQIELI